MGGPGSGGARLRSGPAPDPNALRRDRDKNDWTTLPSEGRLESPPPWPEEISKPSIEELALWNRLWHKPQALVWEMDGVEDSVALYVRAYLEACKPGASAPTRTVVRQMADALLLTIPALYAARFKIAPTKTEPEVDPRHPATPRRSTARNLLTVVEPVRDADED